MPGVVLATCGRRMRYKISLEALRPRAQRQRDARAACRARRTGTEPVSSLNRSIAVQAIFHCFKVSIRQQNTPSFLLQLAARTGAALRSASHVLTASAAVLHPPQSFAFPYKYFRISIQVQCRTCSDLVPYIAIACTRHRRSSARQRGRCAVTLMRPQDTVSPIEICELSTLSSASSVELWCCRSSSNASSFSASCTQSDGLDFCRRPFMTTNPAHGHAEVPRRTL